MTFTLFPLFAVRIMALADVVMPTMKEETLWVAPPPPPPSPEPQEARDFEDDCLDFCSLSSPSSEPHHMSDMTSHCGALGSSLYDCLDQRLPSPFSNIPSSPTLSPRVANEDQPAINAMGSSSIESFHVLHHQGSSSIESFHVLHHQGSSSIESSLVLHHQGSSSIESSLVLSCPSATSSSSTNLDLLSSGYSESCERKPLELPPQQRKRKVSTKRKNTDNLGGMDSGLEASQESGTGGGGGDAEWVVIDMQPSHPIALKKACPELAQSSGSIFSHMLASASSHWGRGSPSSGPSPVVSLPVLPSTADSCVQMECEYHTESMDSATTMDIDDVGRTGPGIPSETYQFRSDVQPHVNGWTQSGVRTLAPPQRDQTRCHSSGDMYVTGGGQTINGFLYHDHLNSSTIPNIFMAHFSKSL